MQVNLITLLTINIEPGAVGGDARPVAGLAGVEAAILHDGAADVDVGNDLAVQRDVLAHHVPDIIIIIIIIMYLTSAF